MEMEDIAARVAELERASSAQRSRKLAGIVTLVERPGLPGQRFGVRGAVALERNRVLQDQFHVATRHFFETQQVLHIKVRARPGFNGQSRPNVRESG